MTLSRFCKLTLVPAFLVGAVLLSGPSTARASGTLTLTLSESGYAAQTFTFNGNPGTVATGVISYGKFSISSDSASSAGSSAGDAQLLTTTLSVRNTSTGSATLTVTVDQTGYTLPAATNLTLTSSLSATTLSHGGSLSFVSSLSGVDDSTINTSTVGFFQAPNKLYTGVSHPFDLDNTTTITLGASGSANTTGTTDAISPEPSSMALAGLGALGLIGYGLRRRKAMGA